MIKKEVLEQIHNPYVLEKISKDPNYEPLLDSQIKRYTVLPIQFPEIWAFYKKHESTFWTVEEIDLESDYEDFKKLSKDEQFFIEQVLAFFAASDGIVNENLVERFCTDVQPMEAKCFYGFQIAIENIHGETYSRLIEKYVKDLKRQNELFNAIENSPAIAKKAKWAQKWIASDSNFATRCVAFACVEGIGFSGSFAAIFWLKKKGLMPGLTFANELISRDEGLHSDFACLLYKYIANKCDKTLNIVKEAVQLEKEFFVEAIPLKLVGMNYDLMCDYIEFVADRLLYELGEPKYWNTLNPFPFMDNLSLVGKTNFFDKKEANYQKGFVGIENDFKFNKDADF